MQWVTRAAMASAYVLQTVLALPRFGGVYTAIIRKIRPAHRGGIGYREAI